MSKEYPWGKGTPTWVRDAATNDSDKSFTVPAGKLWKMLLIHAEIATTATVGNRNLIALITDGTNTVFALPKTANIVASSTGTLNYYFGSGTDTITTGGYAPLLSGGTPTAALSISVGRECYLPAGYVIRVYDVSVVDAAADDLTVVLHYVEYDA